MDKRQENHLATFVVFKLERPLGQFGRLEKLATEFGCANKEELARALVRFAVNNKDLSYRREMRHHIGKVVSRALPDKEYPLLTDEELSRLVDKTTENPEMWDACHWLAEDYFQHGQKMSAILLEWLIQSAARKRPSPPDGRKYSGNERFNGFVVLALNLMREAGFHPTKVDGGDTSTLCGIDFVMRELEAGDHDMRGITYASLAKIWRKRAA